MKHLLALVAASMFLFSACLEQELVTELALPTVTAEESPWTGEIAHYWPDSFHVDTNQPTPIVIFRIDLSTSPPLVHGRYLHEYPILDRHLGDLWDRGFDVQGYAPAPLASAPAVGVVTLRNVPSQTEQPAQGVATARGGSTTPISILAATPTTLTGGALDAEASGATYNAQTGVMSVSRAGLYRVQFAISQYRTVGLSTPEIETSVWTATGQTSIRATHSLGLINASEHASGHGYLRLAAGAELRLRVTPSIAAMLAATNFSLGVERIGP